jgi:hypothetical protein
MRRGLSKPPPLMVTAGRERRQPTCRVWPRGFLLRVRAKSCAGGLSSEGDSPLPLTLQKKSAPHRRALKKPHPMMSMAPLLLGAGGRGFSKISDLWNRFSPPLRAESFEKTGHIWAQFIAKIPREDETPAEAGRLVIEPRGRTPRRVSRPPGGYETFPDGGLRSELLAEEDYREPTG